MIDESRVLETATVAPWLTGLPSKRTIFADDLYFWEGWAAFVAACAREPDDTLLRHLTFVLMKPEATVGRRFDPILDFLLGKGFSIAGAWPVYLSRHAAREQQVGQLAAAVDVQEGVPLKARLCGQRAEGLAGTVD